MVSSAHVLRSAATGITAAEVLPSHRFEGMRSRLQPIVAEMRRHRRLGLGPYCTIVFENRETVLWQIQEVLRVERRQRPEQIIEEIDRYDVLLPREGELRATVFVDGGVAEVAAALCARLATNSETLQLRVGNATCSAQCVERRPELDSPVRYVCFPIVDAGLHPLHLANMPASLIVRGHPMTETPLPAELRRALVADLQLAAEAVDAGPESAVKTR